MSLHQLYIFKGLQQLKVLQTYLCNLNLDDREQEGIEKEVPVHHIATCWMHQSRVRDSEELSLAGYIC